MASGIAVEPIAAPQVSRAGIVDIADGSLVCCQLAPAARRAVDAYPEGESMTRDQGADQAVYDAQRRLLCFGAREGSAAIRCAVSKADLVALEDDALAGPHAMATTYQRNRERIQAVAIRKYHERCFEDGEVVVVRKDDLAG